MSQTIDIQKDVETDQIPQHFKRQPREIAWVPSAFIIAIHIAALAAFFTFSWKAFFLFLFLHWVTGSVGITLGYHRLLTHKSFKAPKIFEYFSAIIGSLACQSGPIAWVATHRLHHMRSDQDGDPHTPTHGFFWSHMGWCLSKNDTVDTWEGKTRFAPDLVKDKGMVFIEKTHILWSVLLGALLYKLGGWPFVVWGIFVRTVAVYHSTWFVNSAAHTWGYKNYKTTDKATNLWWVAIITYGEGWHNNHHAFQYSAKHGLKWWEFDATYFLIKVLEKIGIASAVKIPSEKLLSSEFAPGMMEISA